MHRRAFLRGSAGLVASLAAAPLVGCGGDANPPPPDGWDAGPVEHLLPTASHRRIRLKVSLRESLAAPPMLSVRAAGREQRTPGVPTTADGRFFTFDLDGLAPATDYTLQIHRAGGDPLCDAWPLRTFPAPDAEPNRLRLLLFTCAGGPDDLYNFGFFDAFLPIAHRQRLLARALSFAPDAAVANGDHVYWDLKSRFGWAMGRSLPAWWKAGWFDRARPILGTDNEVVLRRAFGPQIAGLYGVRFRSLPTFFLQDDHDYGENDEASAALRTFPPDPFMLDLARTTQRLYYPELLADETMPRAFVRSDGVAESYGQFRYGRLFEALLYDCRRALTNAQDPALGHETSAFLPPGVESWLLARTAASPCAHLAHMPSTPILWTAGKWGEWYPDAQDEAGVLRTDTGKPYWPEGWGAQHDRLLAAVAARSDRPGLFISGDLHATGVGRIDANRGRALASPVWSVLSGAVGTGALGWPSRFRSQRPVPSGTLAAEELVAPIEENGFSLLDVTPDALELSQFRWTPDQGEAALDTLEPFSVQRILRQPRGRMARAR